MHGSELAGAFASLRANDLVWNYVVNNYLKGETPPAFDLLYWNGDSANLPGPMYVYYLRNLYLDNRLHRARCADDVRRAHRSRRGSPLPAYVYASRDDHIVPWRSAYRTTALLGGEPTFVLGASGHIAGVVNPPAKGPAQLLDQRAPHRPARRLARARELACRAAGGRTGAHGCAATAARCARRLHACGDAAHQPLGAAPGRYVRESA